MSEIFDSFENILILYAPTLLVYITQFIDWFVTLKTFKRLDVKGQVEPVLQEVKNTNEKLEKFKDYVSTFTKEKADLVAEISNLRQIVKEQSTEITEIRDYLKKLIHENIELKDTLRREFQCAVKEQESV